MDLILDERAKEIAGQYIETQLSFAEDRLDVILERQIKLCQSPIERDLLLALLSEASDSYDHITVGPIENQQSAKDLTIWPQFPISKYKIDFGVFGSLYRGKTARVLVECDGHDFHEKTKEQAQKDKSRDRDLQSKGFSVLRFTGSEIFKNPAACAREVLTFIKAGL